MSRRNQQLSRGRILQGAAAAQAAEEARKSFIEAQIVETSRRLFVARLQDEGRLGEAPRDAVSSKPLQEVADVTRTQALIWAAANFPEIQIRPEEQPASPIAGDNGQE